MAASSFAGYAQALEAAQSSVQSYLALPQAERLPPGLVEAQAQLDECMAVLAGMEGSAEQAR